MGEERELVKARNYAYRLLGYRPRSVKEISQRLKQKGFASGVIKKTIEYLSEIDYLNDEYFATAWVQNRLRLRPVGLTFLRYQLRQKGVARQIIDKVFSSCTEDYDEAEAARKLIVSRRRCYKRLSPQKAKSRLYQYLRRRGFSQDVILQAIEQE